MKREMPDSNGGPSIVREFSKDQISNLILRGSSSDKKIEAMNRILATDFDVVTDDRKAELIALALINFKFAEIAEKINYLKIGVSADVFEAIHDDVIVSRDYSKNATNEYAKLLMRSMTWIEENSNNWIIKYKYRKLDRDQFECVIPFSIISFTFAVFLFVTIFQNRFSLIRIILNGTAFICLAHSTVRWYIAAVKNDEREWTGTTLGWLLSILLVGIVTIFSRNKVFCGLEGLLFLVGLGIISEYFEKRYGKNWLNDAMDEKFKKFEDEKLSKLSNMKWVRNRAEKMKIRISEDANAEIIVLTKGKPVVISQETAGGKIVTSDIKDIKNKLVPGVIIAYRITGSFGYVDLHGERLFNGNEGFVYRMNEKNKLSSINCFKIGISDSELFGQIYKRENESARDSRSEKIDKPVSIRHEPEMESKTAAETARLQGIRNAIDLLNQVSSRNDLLLSTIQEMIEESKKGIKNGGIDGSNALAALILELINSRSAAIEHAITVARAAEHSPVLVNAIKSIISTKPIKNGTTGRFNPEIVGKGRIGWTDVTHSRAVKSASDTLKILEKNIET